MATPFDTRQFVSECRDAASANDPVTATRAVVREAVRALASGVVTLPPLDSIYARRSGDLLLGHDRTLFEDEAATVTVVETEPGHLQPPHDHAMCAVIGVFEGGERNRFYRRTGGRARLATRRVVRPAEVIALRERTVHAISADAGRDLPRLARLSGSAQHPAAVAVSSGERYRGAVRLRHLSVLRARGLSDGAGPGGALPETVIAALRASVRHRARDR